MEIIGGAAEFGINRSSPPTRVLTVRRRFQQYRDIGDATFPLHQRGLDIFGIASVTMLFGVTLTGIWQFFAHEPNPEWFEYTPNSGFSVDPEPSTGIAQLHDLFALGCGVVALVGAAWFAYRIAHRLPLAAIVAFTCIVFALLTESLVRFNVIQIEGLRFDQVGPGYAQVFTENVEYVVTDVGQSGPWPFRLLVLAHIATIPILVGFSWWSIRRTLDRRTFEIANAPQRTWYKNIGSP